MKTRHQFIAMTCLVACTASQAETAQLASGNRYGDTARINNVQVLTQHINQPQQVCNQVPVSQTQTQQAQPQKHGMGGALVGSVAGGLLGHTVGEGKGKDAATLGGALVGAMVGNSMQNQPAAPASTTTVTTTQNVTRCYMVDNWVDRQTGAIVSYSYQGRNLNETLPYVPNFRAGDDVPLQVSTSVAGRLQG